MRPTSAAILITLLVTVISVVSIWFFPSIQDFMATNTMWNGINVFTDKSHAAVINSLSGLPDPPEEAVLVAIPYIEYTGQDLAKVKQFVEGGGTLILMDDFGFGNDVLAYLGIDIRFTGKPLLDPLFSYRKQVFPRITDFSPEVQMAGTTVAVLNHATSLIGVNPVDQIAWSSPTSFLDTNENSKQDPDEQQGPLSVAARRHLGKGTVYILADPSIIIGGMINRDDNYRFLEFLIGQPDKLLFDVSHLARKPLDVSKTRLLDTRELLSNPYILTLITVMIFILIPLQILKKRENSG